jgi:hypothetical protein
VYSLWYMLSYNMKRVMNIVTMRSRLPVLEAGLPILQRKKPAIRPAS